MIVASGSLVATGAKVLSLEAATVSLVAAWAWGVTVQLLFLLLLWDADEPPETTGAWVLFVERGPRPALMAPPSLGVQRPMPRAGPHA